LVGILSAPFSEKFWKSGNPTDVFGKKEKKGPPFVRYPEECWHCNSCVLDCNQSAIELRIPLPAMMLHVDAGGKRKRKS
jgi:adenylylsulfate reductase subunit B